MASDSSVVFVEVSLASASPNSPSAGVDGLRAARRLGYRTIVASRDPSFYGPLVQGLVDEFVACDTQDPGAISAAVAGRSVAALLTFSDLFVAPAAAAAHAQGLRGPRPDSPAIARDKALVREVLEQAGLPNPGWSVVTVNGEVPVSPVGYPCIVKPVDGSASDDVRRVANDRELVLAVEAHRSRTTYGRGVEPKHVLLFEEELVGPLWSVAGFCGDGEAVIWGYTDRVLGEPPFYVERGATFGRACPHPALPQFARDVLEATGYDFGPFHLEVILTGEGPQLVEVNPRLPGGGVHDCVSHACGVDVTEEVVKCYLGVSDAVLPEPRRGSTVRILYPPRSGIVRRIVGAERARSLPGIELVDLRVNEGDRVGDPRANGDSFGHLVSVGDTPEEAAAAAVAAEETIRLEVTE